MFELQEIIAGAIYKSDEFGLCEVIGIANEKSVRPLVVIKRLYGLRHDSLFAISIMNFEKIFTYCRGNK